jgi:hypothetical protein
MFGYTPFSLFLLRVHALPFLSNWKRRGEDRRRRESRDIPSDHFSVDLAGLFAVALIVSLHTSNELRPSFSSSFCNGVSSTAYPAAPSNLS